MIERSFKLRFAESEVPRWAAIYFQLNGGWDTFAERAASEVHSRGYLRSAELVALCNWKSPRIRSRCASNASDFVEETTRVALSTTNERLRVEVLTLLAGVQWPVASVILHWCHHEPYPILDFRALWSVGFDQLPSYDFNFWLSYSIFCRDLASRTGVSMRDLDRALWSYSKQNQPKVD